MTTKIINPIIIIQKVYIDKISSCQIYLHPIKQKNDEQVYIADNKVDGENKFLYLLILIIKRKRQQKNKPKESILQINPS